jgi:hypothetical protein
MDENQLVKSNLPPMLLYSMASAPEQYRVLSWHASDLWVLVVPVTRAIAGFFEGRLVGLPENFPIEAFRALRLPFAPEFGRYLSCVRVSKPGLLFMHNGEFIASEALVFFGRETM